MMDNNHAWILSFCPEQACGERPFGDHHRAPPGCDQVRGHIIDLGPEGGNSGGYIVAEGTPEQVSGVEASYTGKYLRGVL